MADPFAKISQEAGATGFQGPFESSAGKDEILRRYDTAKTVDGSGGTVRLAHCSLHVPRGALREKKSLTIKMMMLKRAKYVENDMTLIGPELEFGPDGTKFCEPVNISVSTCYNALSGEKAFEVQTREGRESWRKHQSVAVTKDGNIEFTVVHFSPYRFLMRMFGIEKSIAHMSFTRQNNEDEFEMIWCFCDNIRETRLEVQKEMSLQDFNLTKSTETFTTSATDNIRVSLVIPECEIQDPSQTIPCNDLWFSDSIVKIRFLVRNLQANMDIKYKIEKIKTGDEEPHFTKVNAFTFQPQTGHMDPPASAGTVIVQPTVENMYVG